MSTDTETDVQTLEKKAVMVRTEPDKEFMERSAKAATKTILLKYEEKTGDKTEVKFEPLTTLIKHNDEVLTLEVKIDPALIHVRYPAYIVVADYDERIDEKVVHFGKVFTTSDFKSICQIISTEEEEALRSKFSRPLKENETFPTVYRLGIKYDDSPDPKPVSAFVVPEKLNPDDVENITDNK